MKKFSVAFAACALICAAGVFAQSGAAAQGGRKLWISKFTGQSKAIAAIASVQQSDLAALQQADLFTQVSSFTTQDTQPAGTWALDAKEISFSGGSTAKRALLGFGTGRAHLIMQYELRNPHGKVVWTGKIKTEPSYWGSGVAWQNQSPALQKQAQKLLDALTKYFNSNK